MINLILNIDVKIFTGFVLYFEENVNLLMDNFE